MITRAILTGGRQRVATELDRILDPSYLGDLKARSMNEVRAMRAECQEVETGLSFLRRLVQGRLDIVGVERQRRRDGGEPGELSTLISELPEILADRTRAPGVGRLPQLLAPGEIDPDLEQRLETIVAGHDVESLPELSDENLGQLHDDLEALERDVSSYRRQLFDRIDALQAEITRRYRTGEASVESLLQ
jgi:hypothetical protein